MRRFIGLLATILCSMAAGAVMGPVLIAAATAKLAPARDRNGQVMEAQKLVEAYQARLLPDVLFLSIVAPPEGRECGYNPDVVFPDGILGLGGKSGDSYVDYEGYYVLNGWRSENRDKAWIRAITKQIHERMTPFEAGFLRRCIEATVFSDLCMSKVEQFGGTVPRFHRKQKTGLLAEGNEDRVVCTFVDGVAARKGIPLSSPEAVKD